MLGLTTLSGAPISTSFFNPNVLVNVTGKTMVNTMRYMEYQVTKTILITCISFVLLNVPTALIMMFDPMPPKGALPWLHILGK